ARGITRVAGVLRRRGKSAWLEPGDTRGRGPVGLSSGGGVSGPGGQNGNDGDAGIARTNRRPGKAGGKARGKAAAAPGRPGELRVEAEKILLMAQIDELHSSEAVREAEGYGEHVPEGMLDGREDLTHIPLPTIDPEDARDHDDAVWVERTDDGGYRAWI